MRAVADAAAAEGTAFCRSQSDLTDQAEVEGRADSDLGLNPNDAEGLAPWEAVPEATPTAGLVVAQQAVLSSGPEAAMQGIPESGSSTASGGALEESTLR